MRGDPSRFHLVSIQPMLQSGSKPGTPGLCRSWSYTQHEANGSNTVSLAGVGQDAGFAAKHHTHVNTQYTNPIG